MTGHKEANTAIQTAAPVVKQIYGLCFAGNGPTQIARMLTEQKIPMPGTLEYRRTGSTCRYYPGYKCKWATNTVVHILENREYTGCLVNFKKEKPSYKTKHSVKNPTGVLSNLRNVTSYTAKHEARFMKLLIEQNEGGGKRRNAARKKELEAAEKRIAELSAIFKRLYKDSVTGRISDEGFTELSADYSNLGRAWDSTKMLYRFVLDILVSYLTSILMYFQ